MPLFANEKEHDIDTARRTTLKGVVRGIGILVILFFAAVGIANLHSLQSRVAQQKASALKAFTDFTNYSGDAEFLKQRYSGLTVEVDRIERTAFARTIVADCARKHDDPENKIVWRDDQHSVLYYECVECRIRLEALKYSQDYLDWLSKKRYPPSK